MRQIDIVPEPPANKKMLNGETKKIRCSCGYEDKAYSKDAVGRAKEHNRRQHGETYRIFMVTE
jgi:hypothetical protein